jgi:2,4-dienoyl-CoA reductase-like NADH-dependent reductase (Old Yellow Enzyme family)
VTAPAYPRVAALKTAAAFRQHLDRTGIPHGFDDELAPPGRSPLARPIPLHGAVVGNRFCILPMEGWDGTRDGEPSELTIRRWQHFGTSGAKLIWGGEAVAVRQDGRASPNQLLLTPATQRGIVRLREALVAAHRERFGPTADRDLCVGLQLTHSGRFSRPHAHDTPAPLVAVAHRVLDRRAPAGVHVLEDGELERLVQDFAAAARLAQEAGFAFVDFKHCHGYLAHELLGARGRPGPFGGPLEHRQRFLQLVIAAIRDAAPGLPIVVRLSAYDTVAYRKRSEDGVGVPDPDAPDDFGFGVLNGDDLSGALADATAVIRTLAGLGVQAVCVTAGTPYYNPHIQRPALFPPLDGYEPPEDPLRGVARQIEATARLKAAFAELVFVGSGYSYLQDWLPHVAQHAVATGRTDLVGLGRMALSYPDLPADVLEGRPLKRRRICRTFSDCTTGPRLGEVSGCYPLDPLYTAMPQAARIRERRATRGDA